MLQGLIIRQAFLIADWVLVALIIVGAAVLAMAFMEKPDEAAIPPPPQFQNTDQNTLAQVKPRPIYDRFVNSGLFGSAGQTVAPPPPPPPPPIEVADTELRLKLIGTVATSPRDLFASATILNEDESSIYTFAIGQSVVEGVKVEEIHQRRVILFNSNSNRREVLRSDEDREGDVTALASSSQAASHADKRISINKNELVQEVFMNYADLVTTIKPEMYYDQNGRIAGITASNLQSIPLASKLDIRNGDVLQSVNNEQIDSEAKVIELINKYRDANMVRVGLIRNGRPVTITYRLE